MRALITTPSNPIRYAFRFAFRYTTFDTFTLCWILVPTRAALFYGPYGPVITVPFVPLCAADLFAGCLHRTLSRVVVQSCRYLGPDMARTMRMVPFFQDFTLYTCTLDSLHVPRVLYLALGTLPRLEYSSSLKGRRSFKWTLAAPGMSWSPPC